MVKTTGDLLNDINAICQNGIEEMEGIRDDFMQWMQQAKKELARQKREDKKRILVKVVPATDDEADQFRKPSLVMESDRSARPTRSARNAAISNIRKHTLLPLNTKLRRPGNDEVDDAGYMSGVSRGSSRTTASSEKRLRDDLMPEMVFSKPKALTRKRGQKQKAVDNEGLADMALELISENQKEQNCCHVLDVAKENTPVKNASIALPIPKSVKSTIKQFEDMNRASIEDSKRSVIQKNILKVYVRDINVPTPAKRNELKKSRNSKNTSRSTSVFEVSMINDEKPITPNHANIDASADTNLEKNAKTPFENDSLNIPAGRTRTLNESPVVQHIGDFEQDSENVALERTTTLNVSDNAPLERTRTLNVSDNVPLERTRTLNVSDNAPLERTRTLNVSDNVPLERTRTLNVSDNVPLERTRTLNVSDNVPLERTRTLNVSDNAPLERTRTLEVSNNAESTFVVGNVTRKPESDKSPVTMEPDQTRTRSKSREQLICTETPQGKAFSEVDVSSIPVMNTVINKGICMGRADALLKESTPRICQSSGVILDETSPVFSPVLCAQTAKNIVNETLNESEVFDQNIPAGSPPRRNDSRLNRTIGEDGVKAEDESVLITTDLSLPVNESSRNAEDNNPINIVAPQSKMDTSSNDVDSQCDSYLTAEKSSSRNVTFDDGIVSPEVKRTKVRKPRTNSRVESSIEPEIEEKARPKRTRAKRAKTVVSSDKYETADESFGRPQRQTRKCRTKKGKVVTSSSVDADVSSNAEFEPRIITPRSQRTTRASGKRSADMAEIFGNGPAETVVRKKVKRQIEIDEESRQEEVAVFQVPVPPASKRTKVVAKPKMFDADGNPIALESRATRTRTLNGPTITDQDLPEASQPEQGRPVRTRTKVRRFGDGDDGEEHGESEQNQRVTRTRAKKAPPVEIDANAAMARTIKRKSKVRRVSKIINPMLLKKIQSSEKRFKTPLSALGGGLARQITVLKENQQSATKKIIHPNEVFKTKQLKEEQAALKKQEELKKKRDQIKLKNEEKSQRAMLNRAKIEASRVAKLREMELEQQRVLQEKQRQQEMEEKRARERLEEKKKIVEMERIAKAKAAQARAEAERLLSTKPYAGKYLPKNENDLGLEEENSEDSDAEEPPTPKKAEPSWAAAAKRGNPVQQYITPEQMSLFMAIKSKTPNVYKMFNMTPTRKLRRTSSAIWNTTIFSP